MDEELELVVIEHDDGNELTLEVIYYINYEGKEYAFLTENVEECGRFSIIMECEKNGYTNVIKIYDSEK